MERSHDLMSLLSMPMIQLEPEKENPFAVPPKPHPSRMVVRVSTTMWQDRKGLHIRKDLTFLRRQCVGHNVLADDLDNGGAECIYPRIRNLDTAKDGVYEVVMYNFQRDWESGLVEDWDYRLDKLEDTQ
jgi:hypothetical protein